jgi:hypothetical protein
MKQSQFDVYFNLHKKKFSLKSRYTGRVHGHAEEVLMEDVQFKVSEAGRQRVLREKRKNVHAFVRGQLVCHFTGLSDNLPVLMEQMVELTYNPYKYETFVIKATEEPVFTAKKVVLKGKKIFAIL